ncbi:hypothetical protein EMIHUDRAFT_214955 [Emiliania huxleyi CCMP1516]|uniref:MBD domain-containing protein n=2 Tax=Emiliania huxleyi TaxID=2903 RepID=A0A0D3IIP3_EMIH1|nr:hypothetical protein EMIHUDRAFT_214955 [Emiliania huxleyi CCMP1516]EOD11128.1 hypothetical protein EMIHUDRAFT_214955 [Emiliania huxleyi CCMP1516]|eukprot:XP_005763557.1 hypothetical protein EMIHUDRAFT_214955 [Emiliania huxleyi CCMP1516]
MIQPQQREPTPGRFQARHQVGGTKIYLGCFDSAVEAAVAHAQAVEEAGPPRAPKRSPEPPKARPPKKRRSAAAGPSAVSTPFPSFRPLPVIVAKPGSTYDGMRGRVASSSNGFYRVELDGVGVHLFRRRDLSLSIDYERDGGGATAPSPDPRLPPGWVEESRQRKSGTVYRIYYGPAGEYAESIRQAWAGGKGARGGAIRPATVAAAEGPPPEGGPSPAPTASVPESSQPHPIGMQLVVQALHSVGLSQYADGFDEQGYDDLNYLCGMDAAERAVVAEATKMRPGHAAKFVMFGLRSPA